MSFHQMVHHTVYHLMDTENWNIPPSIPTTCPADAAAVAGMQRMHVTCRKKGWMSVVPSGLYKSVAQISD